VPLSMPDDNMNQCDAVVIQAIEISRSNRAVRYPSLRKEAMCRSRLWHFAGMEMKSPLIADGTLAHRTARQRTSLPCPCVPS
jgi:hypothetical protein